MTGTASESGGVHTAPGAAPELDRIVSHNTQQPPNPNGWIREVSNDDGRHAERAPHKRANPIFPFQGHHSFTRGVEFP